jgi:hypothetical protein
VHVLVAVVAGLERKEEEAEAVERRWQQWWLSTKQR